MPESDDERRSTEAVAVVTAAGEASRFGAPKMLADIGGEPLLNRTIRSLLDGGVTSVVVVTSGVSGHPTLTSTDVPLLADPRVRLVTNPDPSRGMFSSIQSGLGALPVGLQGPILILPGDMPFVRSETVAAVVAACAGVQQLVSPRFGGKRGHPIALPPRWCAPIVGASSRTTLKELLLPEEADRYDLDVADAGVLRDVDVQADLDRPGDHSPRP